MFLPELGTDSREQKFRRRKKFTDLQRGTPLFAGRMRLVEPRGIPRPRTRSRVTTQGARGMEETMGT